MIRIQRLLPFDTPTLTVMAALILMLAGFGSVYPQFLSPAYLLGQLHVGAFLGIVAAGTMVVILMGRIDMSIPWTMTAAAVVATSLQTGPLSGNASILAGLMVGVGVGLINGFGVAVLRVPAIIWTLAVDTILRGAVVYYSAQTLINSTPAPLLRSLGQGQVAGMPLAVMVWLSLSAIVVAVLVRTVAGRQIYAIGTSETAAFLSGIPTRRVIFGGFIFSGLCNALAGMMVAGYANQAYLDMGAGYLLPAIAAVVIGGTSILGGRGSYAGAFCGVLLITLASSLLSVVRAPESLRQIVFGLIILTMVAVYSHRRKAG